MVQRATLITFLKSLNYHQRTTLAMAGKSGKVFQFHTCAKALATKPNIHNQTQTINALSGHQDSIDLGLSSASNGNKSASSFSPSSPLPSPPSPSTSPSSSPSPSTQDPVFEYCTIKSSPLSSRYTQLHMLGQEHYPSNADKSISPLQGQYLKMLMRMTKSRRVLELGCFLGYSAMAMADGMPASGIVYTCEKDRKAAKLARRNFEKYEYLEPTTATASTTTESAPPTTVAAKANRGRVRLVEGDAMACLHLLAEMNLKFDAIFIDADKGGYIKYYEFVMAYNLLEPNGFILADNVLFRGLVPNHSHSLTTTTKTTASASAGDVTSLGSSPLPSHLKTADHMRKFNTHVKADPRVEVVLLPIFDGLSVIMHRPTHKPTFSSSPPSSSPE